MKHGMTKVGTYVYVLVGRGRHDGVACGKDDVAQ